MHVHAGPCMSLRRVVAMWWPSQVEALLTNSTSAVRLHEQRGGAEAEGGVVNLLPGVY